MPNFFDRFKPQKGENRHTEFKKVKDTVLSVKTLGQFGTAKELVNNFLKKYKLDPTTPEAIYFKRILRLKRLSIHGNLEEGLDDEGSLKRLIKHMLQESLN